MTLGSTIRTRLTALLGITHPILLAPMAHTSNHALCAAVSQAGGLGILGAAFTNPSWITTEFSKAQQLLAGGLGCTPEQAASLLGIGLVTFDLDRIPGMLEAALSCHPGLLWLSFGDQAEVIRKIRESGRARGKGARRILVACQVQSVQEAELVVRQGADIVIAQGQEAGGHGSNASTTLCLVPQVAAALRHARSAETGEPILVLAAGGIVSGEGLAASLCLGADGVVMGTRFLPAAESPISPEMKKRVLEAKDGATVRTRSWDIMAGGRWPVEYNGRAIKNKISDQYVGKEKVLEEELRADPEKWKQVAAETDASKKKQDFEVIPLWAGAGLGGFSSHAVKPAQEILRETVAEASSAIHRTRAML